VTAKSRRGRTRKDEEGRGLEMVRSWHSRMITEISTMMTLG
jgi:hypothetical protein